jgi:CheY-like chemotaxis protein
MQFSTSRRAARSTRRKITFRSRAATVLLVDGDPDARCIYGTALEHVGLNVITAPDGPLGLLLARSHQPQVVICELLLPVSDSTVLAAALRLDPLTRQIPVLVVTSWIAALNEVRVLEQTGAQVFGKPLSPLDLLDAVWRVLRKQECRVGQ